MRSSGPGRDSTGACQAAVEIIGFQIGTIDNELGTAWHSECYSYVCYNFRNTSHLPERDNMTELRLSHYFGSIYVIWTLDLGF